MRYAQVSPFNVYAEFHEICVGTLSYFGFWITTSGWRHENSFFAPRLKTVCGAEHFGLL